MKHWQIEITHSPVLPSLDACIAWMQRAILILQFHLSAVSVHLSVTHSGILWKRLNLFIFEIHHLPTTPSIPLVFAWYVSFRNSKSPKLGRQTMAMPHCLETLGDNVETIRLLWLCCRRARLPQPCCLVKLHTDCGRLGWSHNLPVSRPSS